MNRISTIQKRQPIRPDVRPTKVDFSVVKSLYNGQTRLTFQVYPFNNTWTTLTYSFKFYNSSLVLQFTTVLPYVYGQYEYILDYGYVQNYAYKIKVMAQYQSTITGEVVYFTSTYWLQP